MKFRKFLKEPIGFALICFSIYLGNAESIKSDVSGQLSNKTDIHSRYVIFNDIIGLSDTHRFSSNYKSERNADLCLKGFSRLPKSKILAISGNQ